MFEILGGRKFLAFVVALSVLIVSFLVLGKISEVNFMDGVRWIVGLYIGGNVAEKVVDAFVKPTPPQS